MRKSWVAAVAVAMTAAGGAAAQKPPSPGCAPATADRRPDETRGRHAYFDALIKRPDCAYAYSLRDQAELDAIRTVGSPAKKQNAATARKRTADAAVSPVPDANAPLKKRPITYDAAADAARITILATASSDSQQKLIPVKVSSGSLLLTWDFRFDGNFKWEGKGYIARHKTWRLDPGPWLALKTEYQAAAHAGRFAELFMSLPSTRWLGPGTTRGKRETLFPRLKQFYVEPNTWTRAWVLVQDIDKPTCYVSLWAADEHRDPVQLYERIALIPPTGGLEVFRLEYDTSADRAKNPVEMHSWNRNVVALHDVPAAEIPALLKRPVG